MTSVQGADILREWEKSAGPWAEHRATIWRMFAPVTRAIIEGAGICPGQSVLDVAAGPGEPSLTIAEAVGTAGSVTCTDAVAGMVEAAEKEAMRRSLKNVRFRQCLADSLPFPDDSFDAVVSRLGAMFFPDPVAALREMLRVTRPGGRLALVVWHKSDLNPFCCVVTEVMNRHVESTPGDPDAPGAFRFAEPGKLAGIMAQAGAVEVDERIIRYEIHAPISPAEFWTMRSQTSDTLREKLARLSSDERDRVRREIEASVAPYFPENEMRFPAQMILVTGRKTNKPIEP